MTKPSPPITTLSSELAWECPYYRVQRDAIRLPNGSQGTYHVLDMPDSVFIVPVTSEGQIVLIRNYRYTLKQWVWELPAGSIKAEQSPEQAAQEELREECGGVTDKLQFVMKASTMNGIGTNYAHFFIAYDVTLTDPNHEPAEVMTIHPMPIDEVYQLVTSGDMNDVSSMAALLLARPYLENR